MALDVTLAKHVFKKPTVCPVSLLIEKLPTADKKVFLDALANGIPTHPLVYALREEGYKMSDNTLAAHRNGKCKCAKTN